MIANIRSIQVGKPKFIERPDSQEPWLSGFEKSEVTGHIGISRSGLDGDGQADLENHGGSDKAVLCYSADHAEHWCHMTQRNEVAGGMFGENLTLENCTERDVCIGDQFRIGQVIVQVSQPRQPCWKLGRFWDNRLMPKWVIQSAFCGWYLRVLEEGQIESGMTFELVERINPDWSVERAHQTMYANKKDPAHSDKPKLAATPGLSDSWQAELNFSST